MHASHDQGHRTLDSRRPLRFGKSPNRIEKFEAWKDDLRRSTGFPEVEHSVVGIDTHADEIVLANVAVVEVRTVSPMTVKPSTFLQRLLLEESVPILGHPDSPRPIE